MEAERRARKASNVSAAVTVDAKPFQPTIVLEKKVLVYRLCFLRAFPFISLVLHPTTGTFLVETYTCSTVTGVLFGLVTQWKVLVLGDVY